MLGDWNGEIRILPIQLAVKFTFLHHQLDTNQLLTHLYILWTTHILELILYFAKCYILKLIPKYGVYLLTFVIGISFLAKSVFGFSFHQAMFDNMSLQNLSVDRKVDLLNETLLNTFKNHILNIIIKKNYRQPP